MQQLLNAGPGVELFYTMDDFTDPWRAPETVVLVHGLAESGEAWNAWIPHLARKLRVVRLDQRGFGRSTPMPEDFPWSLDVLAGDLARLTAAVSPGPVHVIGAKIGSTVSTHFAATHPELVKTLTVIGLPVKGPKERPGIDPREHGVRAWARSSMEGRLGSSVAPEMIEGWSDLMGKTALSTLLGFTRAVSGFDVSADLPRVACPVLALTSDSKRHPLAEVERWRPRLRHSELAVIPGDGYHVAAVNPDLCARAALAFIERHGAAT